MTAEKTLHFQIRLTNAETEATTWSLADMEWVTNQLERGIMPSPQIRRSGSRRNSPSV